jgi:hypothetical protein
MATNVELAFAAWRSADDAAKTAEAELQRAWEERFSQQADAHVPAELFERVIQLRRRATGLLEHVRFELTDRSA